MTAGSAAAAIQGAVYGAAVPAGGVFATLTSLGMTGAAGGVLGGLAAPIGIAAGGGAYLAANAVGEDGQEGRSEETPEK